jgi:thiol-disulfide isomerase/thioredoxin
VSFRRAPRLSKISLPVTLFSLLALSATGQAPDSKPVAPVAAAAKPSAPAGPSDPRAQKTYQEALALQAHRSPFAIDSFRKADKQDGNHCAACADKVLTLAIDTQDFKLADQAAQELIALAATPNDQAYAHISRAEMLIAMGKAKKKQDCYAEGQKEVEMALALKPSDGRPALYLKGVCLADQQQDDAAKQVFTSLAPKLRPGSVDYQRVSRYAERPDLVRARMAPPFSIVTLDGKRVSMDELHDKVVLIDFWATWCGPCREALPHVAKLAKQFEGQPLVVLSVSLDSDDQKWKDFVGHNNMTWLQFRDGGWDGNMARLFGVTAIPHTFTIDSDGVLQDEHIGDANIEGKLKKLIAQAKQREEQLPQHRQLEASETITNGSRSR